MPVPIVEKPNKWDNVLSDREAEDAIKAIRENKEKRPEQPWFMQVSVCVYVLCVRVCVLCVFVCVFVLKDSTYCTFVCTFVWTFVWTFVLVCWCVGVGII